MAAFEVLGRSPKRTATGGLSGPDGAAGAAAGAAALVVAAEAAGDAGAAPLAPGRLPPVGVLQAASRAIPSASARGKRVVDMAGPLQRMAREWRAGGAGMARSVEQRSCLYQG